MGIRGPCSAVVSAGALAFKYKGLLWAFYIAAISMYTEHRYINRVVGKI